MEVKALTLAQELNQNTLITLPWVVGVTLTLSPIMEASYLLTIWLSPQLDTKREVHPLSFSSTNLTSRSLSHQGKQRIYKNLLLNIPYNSINIWTSVTFRKDATCFRYYGDGTGRDSYMLRDYGGLVCDYSRENKTVGDFYKSLRSGSMSQTVDS
jgi:hypothetical protein